MKNPALANSLLPQYQNSDAFMERMLVAFHTSETPIKRSTRTGGINQIDDEELSAEAFDYFVRTKDKMRSEFFAELVEKLGKSCAKDFCETIAIEWYDGKAKRNSGRPQRLKRSVYEHLCVVSGGSCDTLAQKPFELAETEPLISSKAVEDVLLLNDQFLAKYIYEWMGEHANCLFLSRDEVYLRRGLSLEKLLEVDEGYKEWDFVNSYSIAISAPEKFAQMVAGKKPAIVNGDLDLFRGRILFFAPFIPDMDLGQLEFGIIPSMKPLPVHYQGIHGEAGIHEYLLDPPPYLSGPTF